MTSNKERASCPLCNGPLVRNVNGNNKPFYLLGDLPNVQAISFIWCEECGRYEANLEALEKTDQHLRGMIKMFLKKNRVDVRRVTSQQSLPLIIASQGNPKPKEGQPVFRI
ncbi:MAG: hypothetical protein IPK56_09675 [Elusimicrobia bacterium]|nr:hypothetical protein [Elusimicrobiota bacterium]MBK8126955.1 hypothetical protein [Elusimicrobiota bacterium]